MANIFNNVGGINPHRSVFDLSHEVKFDADMGLLYPVLIEDCIPGDVWKISNEVVVRFHQPLFAPLLHEVNVFTHTFFVPYRILWHNDATWNSRNLKQDDVMGSWELFLSGGVDGNTKSVLPKVGAMSFQYGGRCEPGGLFDFLYNLRNDFFSGPVNITSYQDRPLMFPWLAYNFIWNEYYRDEWLQEERHSGLTVDKGLHRRNWEKDYFTSALPHRQKGTAPAFPVNFSGSTVFDGELGQGSFTSVLGFNLGVPGSVPRGPAFGLDAATPLGGLNRLGAVDQGDYLNSFKLWLNANHLAVNQLTTFDVNDLRMAVQVQKWLERNARAGSRYIELLRAHYGVAPRDERLDRPEYVCGSKSPVIFSEVLKTSQDGSEPQGNMAGHGIVADRTRCGTYRVKEHGIMMTLLSIMPRVEYMSPSIERMWTRDTKYDFYWPEFAHLGEQPIFNREIRNSGSSDVHWNGQVFGYQGRYDEYRQRRSVTHGNMSNSTLGYWHLARRFGEQGEPTLPILDQAFIECRPRKDIYPAMDMPGMILSYGNRLHVARPMPIIPEPGLMDHF